MKKWILSAVVLAAGAAYAATQLEALNATLAQLIGQHVEIVDAATQTKIVTAGLKFNKLELTEKAAKDVDFELNFERIGKVKNLKLDVKGAYSNALNGSDPKFTLSASLNTHVFYDPLQVKSFDELAKEAQVKSKEALAELAEMIAEITGPIQESDVTTNVQTVPNAAGDIEKIILSASVVIDPAKLPAGVTPEMMVLNSAQINVVIDANVTSVSLDTVINAKSSKFSESEMGLKEVLQPLLEQNQEYLEQIIALFKFLDMGATGITNSP